MIYIFFLGFYCINIQSTGSIVTKIKTYVTLEIDVMRLFTNLDNKTKVVFYYLS